MSDITTPDESQFGFDLGETQSKGCFQPNLDEIREDLDTILAAARSVSVECPWDERTYRYNKVVFPQMSRWLPDDEAAQLCFEFSREIERIEALLAA